MTRRRKQDLSEWDLAAGRVVRSWHVELPGNVEDVAVTPDGMRAAWLVEKDHMPASGWRRLVEWWRPKTPQLGHEVWTSAIDGTDLRCLGYVANLPGSSTANHVAWPMDLQWLPRDHAISFFYNDGLYVVPAP